MTLGRRRPVLGMHDDEGDLVPATLDVGPGGARVHAEAAERRHEGVADAVGCRENVPGSDYRGAAVLLAVRADRGLVGELADQGRRAADDAIGSAGSYYF